MSSFPFYAAFALILAVVALIVANDRSPGTASTAGSRVSVPVTLTEFAMKGGPFAVPAGSPIRFELINTGTVVHDFWIKGTAYKSVNVKPGETATLDVPVLSPGTYEVQCTIEGHIAAGMVTTLTVGSTGSATTAAGATHAPVASTADTSAKIDVNATVPAGWKPFDPTLKPAPGGTIHNVTIDATEKVIEVAPGVTQQMWTFNDQVPGPTLRGKVGDVFNVTLVEQGPDRALDRLPREPVAWNDEMRTINRASPSCTSSRPSTRASYMYHCGTAPALHHIGNGMFGAIIVDPPNLPTVDAGVSPRPVRAVSRAARQARRSRPR